MVPERLITETLVCFHLLLTYFAVWITELYKFIEFSGSDPTSISS